MPPDKKKWIFIAFDVYPHLTIFNKVGDKKFVLPGHITPPNGYIGIIFIHDNKAAELLNKFIIMTSDEERLWCGATHEAGWVILPKQYHRRVARLAEIRYEKEY